MGDKVQSVIMVDSDRYEGNVAYRSSGWLLKDILYAFGVKSEKSTRSASPEEGGGGPR
jgi:hypothetical protein